MNKFLLHVRLGLFLVLFAFAVQSAPADTLILKEFKGKGFDYGYEEWKDLASVYSVGDDALHIKASAKGGAGIIFAEPLDLSKFAFLELRVKRPSEAQATLILKLHDGAGKSASWSFDTKDISQTEYAKIRLDLRKPDGGGKDQADFKQINQLQIQGNFNPADRIDIDLESIAAVEAETSIPADKNNK